MAGALDHQLMLGDESTYGTAVTPTRGYEWDLDASNHEWDPKRVQGSGMQVGDGGMDRADRSVVIIGQGKGQIGLDVQTKGMGLLTDGPFNTGAGAVFLVSGTTYQHMFTTALTVPVLDSRTIQYGIVRADAAGTVEAYTYAGCTIHKCTLTQATGEVLKGVWDWDAKSQTKATGLATFAPPAGLLEPFHYGQVSEVTYGGAVTVPTTIALKSGGTAVTNFKSMELTVDDQPDLDRWVFTTRNQPRVSRRAISLKCTAEYDAATYDDALVNHTTNAFTITWTSSQALSTGFATLQLVCPATKIVSTSRVNPGTGTPVMELELAVLKPSAGQALYWVYRTADAAL
jgi:hypothetical protein